MAYGYRLYNNFSSKRLSLFLSAALYCLPLSLSANDAQGLAEDLVRDSKAQASTESLQTLAEDLVRDSLIQADDKRAEALALIEGSVPESRGSFFGLEENREAPRDRFQQEESDASTEEEASLPRSPDSSFSASPQKTCSMESSQSESSAPQQSAFVKGKAGGDFLVFVSFSMNEGALKDLHRQMSRLGGRLVLRGLVNNSFKETQQKIMALGIEADIDPTLFETYGIKRVPTYVLTKKTGDKTFYQVGGHISPQTAIDIFKQKGTLSSHSESLLQQLQHGVA